MNWGIRNGVGLRLFGGLCVVALCGYGCDSAKTSSKVDKTTVALSGRLLVADDQKPVSGASIIAPDGTKATTDEDGQFQIAYDGQKEGQLEARSKSTAPVKKPAPKGSGSVELFAKGYDAQKEVDPEQGGAVVAPSGAKVEIMGGTLRVKDSGQKAERASVALAAPDPRKADDLHAVPGNFDAKKKNQDKVGKLSTESPVYVAASDGDKELELKDGKAKVDLPVREKASQKAADATLYFFDETTGLWVEAGDAVRTTNADGIPIFQGEIDRLGWWTVGTFFDQLTCIAACVKTAEDNPEPFANATITGVDVFSEVIANAGADGCFAADVLAGAQVRVRVSTPNGSVQTNAITTQSMAASASDPSTCQPLGDLTLGADMRCPAGFTECGGTCVRGACTAGEDAGLDAGDGTGSTGGGRDAGTIDVPVDAAEPAPDAAGDPGTADAGAQGGPVDAGAGEGGQDASLPDGGLGDADGDSVQDGKDNCISVPNNTQTDTDKNGIGDACEVPAMCAMDNECPPENYSTGEAAGCCATSALCGVYPNSMMTAYGFTSACVQRNQLGSVTADCPPYQKSGTWGTLTFAGCCRADNTCGYQTSYVQGGAQAYEFNLGCVSYAELGQSGSPGSCVYNGQVGL